MSITFLYLSKVGGPPAVLLQRLEPEVLLFQPILDSSELVRLSFNDSL